MAIDNLQRPVSVARSQSRNRTVRELMGSQITKMMVEDMRKDQLIDALGQQVVASRVEIVALRQEIDSMKGGK
mgnify:CR=1 FL=1